MNLFDLMSEFYHTTNYFAFNLQEYEHCEASLLQVIAFLLSERVENEFVWCLKSITQPPP